MTERSRRRWRIGELAAATGLTVRTLRHYEQLGLLGKTARSEGQQRLYDEVDVRRLYRVRALRDLGLSLGEIGGVIGAEQATLRAVLRDHRARVDAELVRLGRLRTLLDHACTRADDVAPEAVLATIEAMSRVVRRGARASTSDAEAWWRELGEALRACMDAGERPTAARPRELAVAASERIAAFAGGDTATLEALAHLRRAAPPKDLAGWDAALMRYLDEAMRELESGGKA